MKNTNIQWCHSSVNPVMGCDGCELWRSYGKLEADLAFHADEAGIPKSITRQVLAARLAGHSLSDIVRARGTLLAAIQKDLAGNDDLRIRMASVVKRASACYAGNLHVLRAGHSGFADKFERPKVFPGRMALAARWQPPSAAEQAAKPWLSGARRLIFISDMGDALSRDVSFDFLRDEIISAVTSLEGQRHIWLWVTKRPARMAEFSSWLGERDTCWPDNLVPMTTVTSMANIVRVDQLRRIPARMRGLSCEPMWEPLHLDLDGIDWVIAGGGSDELAPPFNVEWALQLQGACEVAGTAFFLKQLGRHPAWGGRALKLQDKHGGDWEEWEESWRVREIPSGFKQCKGSQGT